MEQELRIITREILFGFWKVHILHHAVKEPVVGQWMLQELRRHGYEVSPGTMYPMLQRMERNGWLRCVTDAKGGIHARKSYYLTDKGGDVLEFVLSKVEELRKEVGPNKKTRERKPVKPKPMRDKRQQEMSTNRKQRNGWMRE